MPVPIALQLYSIRDLYRRDFADCLRKTAAMGYAGVECFGAPTLPAEAVTAALAEAGLLLAGWHTPIDLLEGEAFSRTVEYFGKTGVTRAIVPWMDPGIFTARERILTLADRMNGIARRLAPHGIALGYHNHGAEFRPLEDRTLPWAVLMDHTTLIAQLDSGNAMASRTPGLDPAKLVRRWPGRAKTVHLKPYSHTKGLKTMVGEDDIDWPALLTAAAQEGGAEWFIVEYEEDDTYGQLEGAEKCLRALESCVP